MLVVNRSLAKTIQVLGDCKNSFPYPLLTTPAVLLMNKKCSADTMEVPDDCKHVLRFDIPGAHDIKPVETPKLCRVVDRETLKSIHPVNIKMQSQDWIESLDRHFIIGRETLKSIRTVNIKMQSQDWMESLDRHLISAFTSRCSSIKMQSQDWMESMESLDRHLISAFTSRCSSIKMQSQDWMESLDRHLISAFTSRSSKLESFELIFLEDQTDHQWPQYSDNYILHHFFGTLPPHFTDSLTSAMTTHDENVRT
ncbi:uncharacterized protein RCC_07620 [Ramularia collo-cygni]|uniref:Uncharacterized protein n=1 Tax=Ramularia collo-cygni TaxID=112498 RepID=A0A2D3V4Z3_9PEZI|nr:uncharacterized protein RCC_07620 [Ramularia collo-cygni]CZT21755.1 uncharacterized protein RCC_07620 [Ramularia collo-cygni]